MKPTVRQMLATVMDNGAAMTGQQMLDLLLERGMLNPLAVEQDYACREVRRLTAEGCNRCRAMTVVALKLCCSYEKVRRLIYKEQHPQ